MLNIYCFKNDEQLYTTVEYEGKEYHLQAERQYLMIDTERWKVKAKNHTFIFDCNRPLLAKKNLDQYSWDWHLVAGKCPVLFHKLMQDELEKHLRRK